MGSWLWYYDITKYFLKNFRYYCIDSHWLSWSCDPVLFSWQIVKLLINFLICFLLFFNCIEDRVCWIFMWHFGVPREDFHDIIWLSVIFSSSVNSSFVYTYILTIEFLKMYTEVYFWQFLTVIYLNHILVIDRLDWLSDFLRIKVSNFEDCETLFDILA